MRRHNTSANGKNPSPIQEASEEAEMFAELNAPPSSDVELLQPLVWWKVWPRRIKVLCNLLCNRTIFPDYFKRHPYSPYYLLGMIIVTIILPIRWHFSMLLLGIILGYVYAVPETSIRAKTSNESALLGMIFAPLKIKDRGEKEFVKLSISPAIDAELDYFLSSLLTEVINPWFVPLCMSGENDFQSCVRSTVNAAIMNLIKYGSNGNKDIVTLILYGITNAMIVHMEEFRSFEESKLPLDRFLASGRTKRSHHRNFTEELDHVRQILGLLLKKLLPKQESRSILVNSLLREILSSNALAGFIEKVSDPDFINELIIKFLGDPMDSRPMLSPGWNMVMLKVLRGRHLPLNESSGGMYLIIHIGGQRVKTRRVRSANQLWNEVFRFKLSNSARSNFKMYVQLCQFNYMGQNESKGYAKLIPDFSQSSMATPLWLKFNLKPGVEQPVNRSPEVLIEVTTFVGPETEITPKRESPTKNVEADVNHKPSSPESFPYQVTHLNASDKILNPSLTESSDHGLITLEAALQNNELFMEFLEYLESVKAPPYLQFMMNVDALRQFAAISLGIDNLLPNAIDDYFRTGHSLTLAQTELLKTIKHDTADVYSNHFSESGKFRIPLDPGMQQELQEWVARSDRLDDTKRYIGGPIGPNIFVPAYKWVANVLEEVYFPKFKGSDVFRRFLDRARFSTLNFAVDDDRISIFSQDSSAMPPNWTYGDQTYVERQKALSTGIRSRNSSFDDLNDIRLNESQYPSDSSEDSKKIAAEITLARRKLMQIEERIEAAKLEPSQDSSIMKQLTKEKNVLNHQIINLVGLLQELDNKAVSGSEELWIDLKNASVRVTFANSSAEPVDVLSTLISTVGTVLNAVSEPIFEVYVETDLATSVVTRTYTEFYRLHELLKAQFPKVGMISFPEQGMLNTDRLDVSLQAYLQLLVSDEFVRQSSTLGEFVTLEGAFDADNAPAIAMVKKKMRDVFRSATSIISSQPDEQRRNRFYETRERHTSISVNSHQGETPKPSPAFYSVNDLRDVNQKSTRVTGIGGTPTKKQDPSHIIEDEKRTLLKVPSVELPPTPKRLNQTAEVVKPPPRVIEELSDAEIEMLVETLFAFIIETFDLREPNQWLRRKLLGVFKQLLKQAYGDTLNKILTDSINNAFSELSILKLLQSAHKVLFPDGVFISRRLPPPPRSEEQKFATMVEARTVFLRYTPDILQNMAGRYNAICGMTRIFHSLQHKELNKALLFACLDIVIKLIFSERPSQ